MYFEHKKSMGTLFETVVIGTYSVFFEKNRDSQKRSYFSAHIQLPSLEKIILDDRILPRLKKTILEVLKYREAQMV